MKANGTPRVEAVARAMEVKPGTLRKWLANEWTTALTTSRIKQFISVTGIEIDRLMVLETKREILADLDRIDQIRGENPSLAWMLTRDPNLRDKLDLGIAPTRGEILSQIQEVIDEIQGGLVGLQLGESPSGINSWGKAQSSTRQEATVRMPAGEALKRCVIMLTIGFTRALDPERPCRDTVRFRVLGERLLGAPTKDVLGIETFEELHSEVFRDLEGRTTSVIKNKTGLSESVIDRLKNWSYPSDGRTASDTIIRLMEIVIERKRPEILGRYKRAVASLKKTGRKRRVTMPVYWHVVDDAEQAAPAPALDLAPVSKPEQQSDRAVAPGQRISSLERAEPPAEPAPVSEPSVQVPESTLIELAKSAAAVQEILRLHPELSERLPDGLGAGQKPSLCQACPLEAVLMQGDVQHTPELEQASIRRVRELEVIVRTICTWSDDIRDRILREMDNPLTTLSDLFFALELEEPEKFLEQQGLQQHAIGLVREQRKP